MDIQGAGSVVNLNGAVIQTSAVPEKPEEIAAEAALPVSEASEADFSSIDVENTDEADGSQSMLGVLTNASNNAENRGTSIVIIRWTRTRKTRRRRRAAAL
jgi:nucleoid-associated protein YgaU